MQHALLHPYFADFDKKNLLPAVDEEYIGPSIGRIPPDYVELFNTLITIGESALEGEDEEWLKEAQEVPDKMVFSASSFYVIKCIYP